MEAQYVLHLSYINCDKLKSDCTNHTRQICISWHTMPFKTIKKIIIMYFRAHQGCNYAALIKYSKISNTVKYHYNLKSIWIYFTMSLILYFQYYINIKAEFSAVITPVFKITRSFRNHSNMLIWFARNRCNYHWKQKLQCNFQDTFMNIKFRRIAFIWNIFFVTL